MLNKSDFDLALCDVQMPGESGLDLAEEISREYEGTSVVLVTGLDDPAVAEHAFKSGAHGYLVKPYLPGQLLITAMNALARRDLERAVELHHQELELQLQALVDNIEVPLFVKNLDGIYLVANHAVAQSMGMTRGEIIGSRDQDILTAQNLAVVRGVDDRIRRDGVSHEQEETFEVDGETRVFLTIKFPLVDAERRISAIGGIATDITAKKQAEHLQRELTRSQERAIYDLKHSRLETVHRLAKAVEFHDKGTGEHIERMATVASFLASQAGLNADQVDLIRSAAPMHDVGKIGVSDQIIRKPGKLTDEERQEMELHTVIGYEMLKGSESDLLAMAATIALTHHERWDGGGYPNGLEGEDIPIEGRLVAVADVFDALLSDRSYRPAFTLQQTIEMMKGGRGSQFDPELVDILLDNLDRVLAMRG